MENNLLKYLTKEEFEYVKNEKNLYKKSYVLVSILFKDKVDKNNWPYLEHLVRVSVKMKTLEGRILGLLHDIIEDIKYITFDDLVDVGIPDVVMNALKLVTKKKYDKDISKEEKLKLYNEEIDNIINSNNKLAIELKYADMSDNYDLQRLNLLEPVKREWFKLKYRENIKKLEKVRDNYDRY